VQSDYFCRKIHSGCSHILPAFIFSRNYWSNSLKTNKAKQKALMQSNMNFGDVETGTSLPREKMFMLNYLISLQSSLLCNDAELIHQLFLAADS
jgi:hypothetical protein